MQHEGALTSEGWGGGIIGTETGMRRASNAGWGCTCGGMPNGWRQSGNCLGVGPHAKNKHALAVVSGPGFTTYFRSERLPSRDGQFARIQRSALQSRDILAHVVIEKCLKCQAILRRTLQVASKPHSGSSTVFSRRSVPSSPEGQCRIQTQAETPKGWPTLS